MRQVQTGMVKIMPIIAMLFLKVDPTFIPH